MSLFMSFKVAVAATFTSLALAGSAMAAGGDFTVSTESIGGEIKEGPSAVLMSGGKTILVFARGMDDAMWENAYSRDKKAWRGREKVGGVLNSSPSCIVRFFSTVDCFVQTTGAKASHISKVNGMWSAWDGLGGPIKGAPFAATDGAEKILLTVWNDKGGLSIKPYIENLGGWKNGQDHGGQITTSPSCVVIGNDYKCFAAGTDGKLWMYTTAGFQKGWQGIGGETSFRVSAIPVVGFGQMQVYMLNGQGNLVRSMLSAKTGFGAWEDVAPLQTSGPSCVQLGMKAPMKPIVQCFTRAPNGSVQSTTITPN